MPGDRNAYGIISELWDALGLRVPAIVFLDPDDLPPAYHSLLVHRRGMTETLERHWRDTVCVELLSDDISLKHRSLFRFVALHTGSCGKPVEIALIRIPLETFPPPLRRLFIEAKRPFGALLAEAGIRFEARPQAYFTFVADGTLAKTCGLGEGTRLYGRINQLWCDDGSLLCETVEALPQA